MNAEALALVPFILFAAVMTGTPGPNNAMVTVSAARIGARRTMPLVLGIATGTALMFVAMAFGLHALLARMPVLDGVLRILAAGVLVWIAWKILNAGPLDASDERPLLGYLGGAAFQWVNPKAWAITGSGATIYLPVPADAIDIGVHALLLCAVGACLVSLWALLGAALRGPLARPTFARVFNTSMALLLVASTLPVLLGPGDGSDTSASSPVETTSVGAIDDVTRRGIGRDEKGLESASATATATACSGDARLRA